MIQTEAPLNCSTEISRSTSRSATRMDVTDLYHAAQSALPGISFEYFMGMTGLAARTIFCSIDCSCADQLLDFGCLTDGLGRLGLRSVQPSEEGPGIARQPYVLRKLRRRKGAKVNREILAVADLAAHLLEPPVPMLCTAKKSMLLTATGVWSYSAVVREIGWRPKLARTTKNALEVRLRAWIDSRATTAPFLRKLAGGRRTRYAVRLKRAAEAFDRELRDGLQAAKTHLLERKSADIATIMADLRIAAEVAGLAAQNLIDAACIGAHTSEALRMALLEGPETALTGAALQEVVYLARSGARPFRQLAARRLSGSRAGQGYSTLCQLLYDRDYAVAITAAGSILDQDPEGSPKALAAAAANLAGQNSEAAAAILLMLAENPDRHSLVRDVLEQFESLIPSNPLLSQMGHQLREPRGAIRPR